MMMKLVTVYCKNENCPEHGEDRDLDKDTEAVENYFGEWEWTCPSCGEAQVHEVRH
jgi:hypothetical protein